MYYAEPQADWSLGDIVIAPAGVFWAAGERPSTPYPPPAPPADGSRSVVHPLWLPPVLALPIPPPLIEGWLTRAVIVVDDCVLDKEFNALVDRLVDAGVPESQAEARARGDESLDPLVSITPLLRYEQLHAARADTVRQAGPVGYFPVVSSEEVDEGYIDFTRTFPVSRRLLWGPLAAMSEAARRVLRWKLAQFYALRNLSIDVEIMSALGKTITGVQVVLDNRDRLVVALQLDGGLSEIRLRQEPRRSEIPPGHLRGRPP